MGFGYIYQGIIFLDDKCPPPKVKHILSVTDPILPTFRGRFAGPTLKITGKKNMSSDMCISAFQYYINVFH